MFESIQIVIDISCHLVTKYNLGNPETFGECIDYLKQEKYINTGLAGKLSSMIGFGNLLIHECIEIDVERLFALLNNLKDFRTFAGEIKDFV